MAKKSPKPKDNFTRNLVIAVVVGVASIMVIPNVLSQKVDVNAAIPSNVSAADGYGIAFNSELQGVPTVDIWEDFQCPVCGQFEGVNGDYIASIIAEKKAKVVFHPLSFIGSRYNPNESKVAANAAACSADEDKFIAFHSGLYKILPNSENSGLWTSDYMIDFGASLGITSEKFKSCVRNMEYGDWVDNIAKDGAAKNINSTPTVLVNGKELDRNTQYFNPVEFQKAIEGAK